jgi:hypothetical protein
MHPKSPGVSGPDGAATLMYKMGKEDWLKRFLDVEGTHSFELQMKHQPWQDLYIKRQGRDVEVLYLAHSLLPTLTLVSDRLSQHLSKLHSRAGARRTLSRSKFWRIDTHVYF